MDRYVSMTTSAPAISFKEKYLELLACVSVMFWLCTSMVQLFFKTFGDLILSLLLFFFVMVALYCIWALGGHDAIKSLERLGDSISWLCNFQHRYFR